MPGYHQRKGPICSKICSLLTSLAQSPSLHDEITPKIEYWIEYVLREGFANVDELVEGVSEVAWFGGRSFASVGRFLKEFHDAPHRSEDARSFVAQLCPYVLRRFAIASVEDIRMHWTHLDCLIPSNGANGFIGAASFVGSLIEWGLLTRELARQHLIKPLTNHQYTAGDKHSPETVRANAIYQLFIAAGNTLLHGLLEPEDVQVCFGILEPRREWIMGFESAKLQEFREIHAAWMQRMEEESQKNARESEECQGGAEDTDAEVSAEAETPVAFVPQNLPAATIDIEISPSISQDIEPSVFDDVDSLPEPFISVATGATSSPTLSISTISDFTPTELGEDIEHGEEKVPARHDTFYFEDGNAEIICGSTVFRVHSTVVSFSSPTLRDILFQSTLRHAPTPGECPRVTISESAEDFAVLLKMVYTPGFPPRHEVPEFTVFASLLRMTTKYGFSSVRDQLVKDIRDAYPTKWEDFQGAKVLGEDLFGSPKPHPNAVLNLFEAEKVQFAIPFAAYRASIGGFSALMSDKPGTALPPRTLATAINGMHVLRAAASDFAHIAVYMGFLRVCSNESCTLNVEISSVKKRVIAMEKVYSAVIGQREGGLLSPPSLGHLLCTKCAKDMEMNHAICAPDFWTKIPPAFNIALSWDDL